MSRERTQLVLEWGDNPPEWQYAGFASSNEELEELKEESIEGRRRFLYAAAKSELARRVTWATVEVQEEPGNDERFDFSTLPIRPTISQSDCDVFAAIYQYRCIMRGERPSWDAQYAKRIWRDTAHSYAYMNGYGFGIPKFSNKAFEPSNPNYKAGPEELERIAEEHYEKMLDSVMYYQSHGFGLRFFTDGILKIEDTCLDVVSLQRMIGNQRRRRPDNRYFGERGLKFWADILDAKREFDKRGPYKDRQSYSQVVDELGPGVYSAPYVDPDLVASRKFISIDDWQRGVLNSTGVSDMSKLVKGFNTAVALAAKNERYLHRNHYSQQDPLNRHGALFFDRQLLPSMLAQLEEGRPGAYLIPIIRSLMAETESDIPLDEDYLQIVFGTRSVSKEVEDLMRSQS